MPHIGHAYTTLACDVLARFMRLDGYDVRFLTGTDEHGRKVDKAARAAGVDHQAFVDKVSQNFRDLAKALNFSNDDFIRTTEPRHIKSTQHLWKTLADRRRDLSRQVCRLVCGARRSVLWRGRADGHAGRQANCTVTVYQYLQLTSTQFLNLGGRARETPFPGVIGTLTITVTPTEIVYGLPAGIGTRWNTAFSNRTLIVLGGITVSDVTTTHNARYSVDAWGPLTLPGGTVQQALRIRKVNLYNGGPVLSYIWLTRSGASVQVEGASGDTTIVSGTLNVARGKTIWNSPIIQLDVKLSDNVPSEFSLKQNYPNPFNPSTRIEYQVATEELVSLKVYNLLGQEVVLMQAIRRGHAQG